MHRYDKKLEQYLKEHPIMGRDNEIGEILAYLARHYMEDNPIESEKIREIEQEMEPYYENVPFAASERLFRLVYDLCDAYGDAAFQAGITMGLHLREEISKV